MATKTKKSSVNHSKKRSTAKKVSVHKNTHESDGAYFLKLVLFLIFSSLWLRIEFSTGTVLPLPLGAAIALLYAMHDHFQIDRKIELALILVGMFVSFWLPIGIFISL
jgi:hypothetical protein